MAGALEKRWFPAAQSFTIDGSKTGIVNVADATGFYTKQQVAVSSSAAPTVNLEVKIVLSPTQIAVGLPGVPILGPYFDLSAYKVINGAKIVAANQVKPQIQPPEIFNGVYEHDPIVALRSVLVDKFGQKYDSSNPLPIAIAPSFWDEIDATYDVNDVLQTVSYTKGADVNTLTISYDADYNLIKIKRT